MNNRVDGEGKISAKIASICSKSSIELRSLSRFDPMHECLSNGTNVSSSVK